MDEEKRKEASKVLRKMREAGGRVVLEENDVPRMARALDNLMADQAATGSSTVMKALEALAQNLAQQQQAFDRMAKAMTAPKRIIKDAEGRVEGVETIMPTDSDPSQPPVNVIIEK